jgi:hypothetical protein
MYVVGNRQVNVERDGKLVALNPGEPVPEAAAWPHDVLMRCMKIGQIVSGQPANVISYPLAKTTGPAKVEKAKGAGKSTSKPIKSIGKSSKKAS